MVSKATQALRGVAVSSPLGEDVLLFRRMQAREELGRLFEMQLEVLSEKTSIPFADLLGKQVTVRLELPAGGTRYFNGYATALRSLGVLGRYSVYALTLRPWLWLLTRTADCKIFQDMTVPDILKQVFRDFGFSSAFKDSLSGSYRTWEYCVQYRESAFSFVSRLMEHEGIYYYFTHEDGNHTLVLSDAYSSHRTFPGYATAVYVAPDPHRAFHEEHVCELGLGQELATGRFVLDAFDFEVPSKVLKSTAPASWDYAQSSFEIFDYPGTYAVLSDGDHYSRVCMEELAARQERVTGSGNLGGLAAGALIALEKHPVEDCNREYLVIATDYRIASGAYESGTGAGDELDVKVDFLAQDAGRQFRSERLTPKPVVRGPQTAMVVGKSGEEIWTDKYGRVKVRFHWDRYAPGDETSSCWVRVAQVWAGKRWGGMAIPRIGQEVIVDFLEGDPDRPIVTGRVYNGDSMPVYGLPGLATVTGIKSDSSKGGGGFNELRFEDKKGSEQVFFHAEKNLDVRVKNDRREWIGHDRHLMVDNDKLELVKNDRHEKVTNNHAEEIGGKRHLKVAGEEAIEITGNRTVTVKANMAHVFTGNHTEETTGNYYLKAAGVVIEATSGITLKCGGSSVVLDASGVTVKGSMVTVDGSMVKIASGPGSPPTPGSPGSPASPQAPKEAEEADNPSPG